MADTSGLSWHDMRELAAAAHREARDARADRLAAEQQAIEAQRQFEAARDVSRAWSDLAQLIHGKPTDLPDLGSK